MTNSNDNKTSAAKAPKNKTDNTAKREPVETRRVERLDAFIARVGAPIKPIQKERRGRRKKLADIKVPQQQISANAMRLGLRSVDVIFVTTIIMLSVWNAYIGTNNRGVIAPIAAGLLGAAMFIFMLFSLKAHRFAPSETYGHHMRKVATASAAALGLWLTIALMTRPDTFHPYALSLIHI